MRTALPFAAFLGLALFQSHAQTPYAFEGSWAQSDHKCSERTFEIISQKEWRQTHEPALQEPDDVCKITSITQQSTSEFTLAKSCKDNSGDGPSVFKETSKIVVVSPTQLKWKPSTFNGQVFTLNRCQDTGPGQAKPLSASTLPPAGVGLVQTTPAAESDAASQLFTDAQLRTTTPSHHEGERTESNGAKKFITIDVKDTCEILYRERLNGSQKDIFTEYKIDLRKLSDVVSDVSQFHTQTDGLLDVSVQGAKGLFCVTYNKYLDHNNSSDYPDFQSPCYDNGHWTIPAKMASIQSRLFAYRKAFEAYRKQCGGLPSTLSDPGLLNLPPIIANASEDQVGFICDLTIQARPRYWHISIDVKPLSQGFFTARSGRMTQVEKQAAIIEPTFGSQTKLQRGPYSLWVNLNAFEAIMRVDPDGKTYLQPYSGTNPKYVGQCKPEHFRGL
jgi:hypothetical protein